MQPTSIITQDGTKYTFPNESPDQNIEYYTSPYFKAYKCNSDQNKDNTYVAKIYTSESLKKTFIQDSFKTLQKCFTIF